MLLLGFGRHVGYFEVWYQLMVLKSKHDSSVPHGERNIQVSHPNNDVYEGLGLSHPLVIMGFVWLGGGSQPYK
jgi:hypothetical protein